VSESEKENTRIRAIARKHTRMQELASGRNRKRGEREEKYCK